MKLLHVTDLHYNRRFFDWIWAGRKEYDAICLTGDLLLATTTAPPLETQSQWVADWLGAFDATPIFVCSGNHDLVSVQDLAEMSLEALFSGYDDESFTDPVETSSHDEPSAHWLHEISNSMVFTDSTITELDGKRFGCVSYLVEDFTRFCDCDILLHHVPPSNTGPAISNGHDFGCDRIRLQLTEALLRPAYLLCGHVHAPVAHRSRLAGTQIVNPGARLRGDMPMHRVLTV